MLYPELIRELRLDPAAHPHGKAWLSAASGLVLVGGQAYVVADDEHHLARAALAAPEEPLELIRLFEGHLPVDEKARKKLKPDLESLVLLPPLPACPHGALFALGSGSRPQRCRGQLLPLDAAGEVNGPMRELDLAPLYAPLGEHFADLNIEGAFVAQDELCLLQRGNKGSGRSACIRFDRAEFLRWLQDPRETPPGPGTLQALDFGSIDGVPLAPTDAAGLGGGRWLVSVVAEDTSDSYQDGACLGSAIGIVDMHGGLEALHPLHGSPKVEGIALMDRPSGALRLLLVTDADDPGLPAQLLRLDLPRR